MIVLHELLSVNRWKVETDECKIKIDLVGSRLTFSFEVLPG